MIQFLPYALAAYGGYRGYKDSKDQGIGGINRLLNTALGAYTGYNLGQAGGFAQRAGFQQPSFLNSIPGLHEGHQPLLIQHNKCLVSEIRV